MTIVNRQEASYRRRSLAMRQEYGMQWSRREADTFINRVMYASCEEGVDDRDLRSMVRMYNRECIGRRNYDFVDC